MNLIYSGESGLLKRQTAEKKAREFLAGESLDVSSDFLLVEPAEEGANLKIEQIETIREFVSMKTVRAEKKVVLIDKMETASDAFQNAMLKFLEDDSNHCHFILVTGKRLLDTVNSRCVNYQMKRLNTAEMKRYIDECGLPEDDLALAVAGGRPAVYEQLVIGEKEDFLNEIRTFVNAFKGVGKNPKVLFEALGLVKENGTTFFDSHDRDEVDLFFEFVQNLFIGILYNEIGAEECSMHGVLDFAEIGANISINCLVVIYERCMEDKRRLQKKGAYTKNDFFEFFRFVYSLIGKE